MLSLDTFRRYDEQIRNAFWYLPTMLTVSLGLLAMLLIWVDQTYVTEIERELSWLFQGTPDAARALLAAIAGSLITVISIAFSLMVIAIQQAATQYSPRVLRTFIGDRGNQLVLGMYIATFLYALLVLRSVRSAEDGVGGFVPRLSVTTGLLLTIVCLGLLIYFINQISRSLQVSLIIHRIYTDLLDEIEHLFPEQIGRSGHEPIPASTLLEELQQDDKPYPVLAQKAGFVHSIDQDELSDLDTQDYRWIYITAEVGSFVHAGDTIALLDHDPVTDEKNVLEDIRTSVSISTQRSTHQDPLFAIRQLTDIAIHALSPGINDPTTAEYCMYHLTDALRQMGNRSFPEAKRVFSGNTTVFLFNTPDWETYVRSAYDQIRFAGRPYPHVMHTLVAALHSLENNLHSNERRAPVRRQLEAISNAVPLQQNWTEAEQKELLDAAA